MLTFLVVAFALLVDRLAGEPARAHPLVAFGRFAARVHVCLERRGMADTRTTGALAVLGLAVLPALAVALLAASLPAHVWLLLEVAGLYLALALRSLEEHARAVAVPLADGDLMAARKALGMLVSRDTEHLDREGVAAAATESVLENGADAVFASLFWYLLAGLPGVVLHRLVNTLDAMWGYRSTRYRRFGWAAARLDDVLNLIPARLTGLTYAACGRFRPALACWRQQGRYRASPNAAVVMASGAGALGVKLPGAGRYRGRPVDRPPLGAGVPATAATVRRAVALVRRGVVLWLLVLLLAGVAWQVPFGSLPV